MIIFPAASQSKTETLQLVTKLHSRRSGLGNADSISNINSASEGTLDSSWHKQLLLKVADELPLKGE